jgi:hypothetical protein
MGKRKNSIVVDWDTTSAFKMDGVTSQYAQEEIISLYESGYERQYPQKHMAAGDILPHKYFEGYEGENEIEIYQYDSIGIAGVIASHERAGPPVTSVARRVRYRIETQGNAAYYSWQEIHTAGVKGRNLEDRKIKDLKKAEENYYDFHGWFGDEEHGLYGLHTLPIPRYFASKSLLDAVDADEIVQLLDAPLDALVQGSAINIRTQGNRTQLGNNPGSSDRAPKILVLPNLQARRIWKERAGTDTFAADIWLQASEKQGLVDTIIGDDNCRGAGPNGEDLGYLLPWDDEKMCIGIFHPYELIDPQRDGLRYEVLSVFRTSLAMAPDPTSALRIIGV